MESQTRLPRPVHQGGTEQFWILMMNREDADESGHFWLTETSVDRGHWQASWDSGP